MRTSHQVIDTLAPQRKEQFKRRMRLHAERHADAACGVPQTAKAPTPAEHRRQKMGGRSEDAMRLHTLARSHHQMAKNWLEGDPPVHAIGELTHRPHIGSSVIDESTPNDQLREDVARMHELTLSLQKGESGRTQ